MSVSLNDVQRTGGLFVIGCVFGKRKRRGACDTQRIFSVDGGRDRFVCIVSAEDFVTVISMTVY